MVNGGAWDITYDDQEQAFVLKNVALNKYLSANGASDTPDYWYIKTTFMSYEANAVSIVYETIKDPAKSGERYIYHERQEGLHKTLTKSRIIESFIHFILISGCNHNACNFCSK